MKIENFCTDRSRTYISRGKPNQSQYQRKYNWFQKFTLSIGIISVLKMGYWEYGYMQQLSSIHSLTTEAQKMPYGNQGVDYLVDYNQDNKIVYLQNVDLSTQDINDQEFGFEFQGLLSSKREMEYCQWEQEKSAERDSEGDTTYTYHYDLGWHSHLIKSQYFQYASHYTNPQRNPIQNQDYFTQALVGQKIQFNTFDISNSPLMDYQQYYIPHDTNVGDIAYYNGFIITTEGGKWAYSKYQEDYSYLKNVSSLKLKEVKNIQKARGICIAGDIRATWLNAKNPGKVSIIGLYKNNVLQPASVNNGIKYLLAVEGSKDLEQIDYIYTNMIKYERSFYRYTFLILITVIIIIFLVSFDYNDKKNNRSQLQSLLQQQQQLENEQKQKQINEQKKQDYYKARQAKKYQRKKERKQQQKQQCNYDDGNNNVNQQQQFTPKTPIYDNPSENPLNQHQKKI